MATAAGVRVPPAAAAATTQPPAPPAPPAPAAPLRGLVARGVVAGARGVRSDVTSAGGAGGAYDENEDKSHLKDMVPSDQRLFQRLSVFDSALLCRDNQQVSIMASVLSLPLPAVARWI